MIPKPVLAAFLLLLGAKVLHADCQEQPMTFGQGEKRETRQIECCAKGDLSTCPAFAVGECTKKSMLGKSFDQLGRAFDCSPIQKLVVLIHELYLYNSHTGVRLYSSPGCLEGSPYSAGASRSILKYTSQYSAMDEFFKYQRMSRIKRDPAQVNTSSEETIDQRLAAALGKKENAIHNYATEFSRGTFNRVYFVHHEMPPPEELLEKYSDMTKHEFRDDKGRYLRGKEKLDEFNKRLKKRWAQENSTRVVKVMVLPDETSMKEQIEKDNILRKLLEEALKKFSTTHQSIKGRPLLRLAKTDTNHKDQSVVLQEFVPGPSAYEIGNLTLRIRQNKDESGELRKVLIGYGFRNLESAEKALAVLEAFYVATHHDVMGALTALGVNPTQNIRTEEEPGLGISDVGFDFNHGRNVIWDIENAQFCIIDF